MSENTLQLIAGLKLLLVAGFAMLYGMGGISGKWKRRFIAPVLLGIGTWGLTTWTQSFSLWLLLSVFFLFGALSIGYGASATSDKIRKRAIAGLAAAFAMLPYFWVTEIGRASCRERV